jgi:hypothetical protein
MHIVVSLICNIEQWYSTFFFRELPDVIFLKLCNPRVGGALFKLYTLHNPHQNKFNKLHPKCIK